MDWKSYNSKTKHQIALKIRHLIENWVLKRYTFLSVEKVDQKLSETRKTIILIHFNEFLIPWSVYAQSKNIFANKLWFANFLKVSSDPARLINRQNIALKRLNDVRDFWCSFGSTRQTWQYFPIFFIRFSWFRLSLRVHQIGFSWTWASVTKLVLNETSSILRD